MSPPNTLIVTHENADVDGIGGLVALSVLHPGARLLVPHGLDDQARKIWQDHAALLPPLESEKNLEDALNWSQGGVLLVSDTSRPARIGAVSQHLDQFARVECFDTHPAEPDDLPRAELPPAASCTAALACLLDERGLVPSPVIAGVMLIGIHVDTGHFTFPATTDIDHRGAALCIGWGAPVAWVRQYVPRGLTSHELMVLQQMAQNVRHVPVHGISVAIVHLETDTYLPELGALLTTLREAEGWPVAVLVNATEGRVWVIGRSDGCLDVGVLCHTLGGGGHAEAASAVLTETGLADALRLVEETLADQIGQGRRACDLMVRPFVGAPADASVREVAELLHRHRINGLPLFKEGEAGRPRSWVGQVSRQEVDAALRHGLCDAPAWQVSAREPGWVPADAPLSRVRETLLRGQGRIWLVGEPDGEAPGLITRTTVLRAAAEPVLGGVRRPPNPNVMKGKLRRALGTGWSAVQQLGALAAELGTTPWLVGGGVRDLLRDQAVRDADVVVEGDAPALARAAAERLGGTAFVHEAFDTAKWTPPDWSEHDEPIDIASARGEHYTSRAVLPSVMQAELRRDLYRRDFTINAMAVCLHPDRLGEVLDPYGGWGDLQNGVLRVLHGLSFHDDPTRAIRAARFAARFDLTLAPGTRGLLDGAVRSGVFDELSEDRLGNEVDRLLREADPVTGLRKLRAWGLMTVLHRQWTISGPLLDRMATVVQAWREVAGAARDHTVDVPCRADCLWVVLAGGLDARLRAERSGLVPGTKPRRTRFEVGPEPIEKAVRSLGAAKHQAHVARNLQQLDEVQWVVGLGLARRMADAVVIEEQMWWWRNVGRHQKTAVDGRWLMAQNHRPSPAFSKALRLAQMACWDGADVEGQRAAALRAFDEDQAVKA